MRCNLLTFTILPFESSGHSSGLGVLFHVLRRALQNCPLPYLAGAALEWPTPVRGWRILYDVTTGWRALKTYRVIGHKFTFVVMQNSLINKSLKIYTLRRLPSQIRI